MRRVLILILLTLIPQLVEGQVYSLENEQLHFRRFSVKDGLPSVYINTIFQRSNGIMWIGTKGGLTRFDGQNMSNYFYIPNKANSLNSNDITSLFEDEKNQLWVGTSNGVNLFNDDANEFINIMLEDITPAPIIFYITQDDKKNIWLGTSHGVFVLNQQKKIIWRGLKDHSVKFIVQSDTNKVWIASKQGVKLMNPEGFTFTSLPLENNASINYSDLKVYDGLLEESSLWLATSQDGLLKIDTNTHKVIEHYSGKDNAISNKSIWSLAKRDSGLWLGYFYDGISHFTPETKHNIQSGYHPQINYTLPYNNVSKLFFDNSGLLWVATTNGLSVTDPKNRVIKHIGEYQNITNKHVWSVARDDNDIWFATEDGLNKVNIIENTLTTYPSSENAKGLPRTVIWSIYPQKNTIWLGTNKGLIKFLPKENKAIIFDNPYLTEQRIRNRSIYSMQVTNNTLLLGYYNGSFAKFDIEQEQFVETLLNVSSGYITNIIEYSPSEYIVASQYGMMSVVKDKVKKILPNERIANYHITAMRLLDNQLWVATLSNGLYVLANKDSQWHIIKHLSSENSLPENTVKSLSIDLDNNVWVTGRKSVFNVSPNDFKVTLFTSLFHWLDMEFNDNASNPNQDNTILLGGNEGLVYFTTTSISEQKTFPALKLSSVQVADRKYPQLNSYNDITITPDDSFYSFSLSALEFLSPESIKYEYQLLPGQAVWQSLEQSTIMLSNLPYDQYTLRVRATNSDNVLNNDLLEINLDIPPPFWLTTIAKLFYSLILLTIIFRFIFSHQKRLNKMTIKATHDALTGLPNRDYLINELNVKLKKASSEQYQVAVLFFDLNGFKLINDTYGHDVGDKLLIHVAKTINQSIRDKDFFARQSGDEFILLLDNINTENDISLAIQRIQSGFKQAFIHDEKSISYGSSIGVSIYKPNTDISGEELIKQADQAMYQCKKDKLAFCYYHA
ncbi:ligand-binding sensor domain-containing diguanylate cyclase [Colwellia sp. RSH04]|uniref:ligand-binding sensor domain-containing diguanylate cyclase n=1 Tax=Colwellia sp. RSH04 TaxID=2305464 RepID=UPI000E57B1FD|nr:ligand-binding sensor domain-containing diguanylate cyclase [Colwellia sp. RSH04]RHW76121.1 GGDEF domain-containing protein [Colwellia sp. RSH04]